MGYASNRPVSSGEFDDGGLEGFLHKQQFAPSSTAVRRIKQPGLGFTPSFGILTDPAGYNPPKTTTTITAIKPLFPAPKPAPLPAPIPAPVSAPAPTPSI